MVEMFLCVIFFRTQTQRQAAFSSKRNIKELGFFPQLMKAIIGEDYFVRCNCPSALFLSNASHKAVVETFTTKLLHFG